MLPSARLNAGDAGSLIAHQKHRLQEGRGLLRSRLDPIVDEMVSDTIPQLKRLSLARKRRLISELVDEVYGDPVRRGGVATALAMRMDHFRQHPDTARSWTEVKARLQRKK